MALSDERIAELKEVALKIAPLHRSAARPFARSIEAEVRKEYEARIAELEAQLEAVGAEGVGAMLPRHAQPAPAVVESVARDRLLAALERANAAESALRALVDECDNDMVVGWEDRMSECIARANKLLAAPPPQQIAEPASQHTAAIALLQQAFDALEATADSDLDYFEDEEEEAEAVPAQYACRKIMQAMQIIAPTKEPS